MPQRKGKITVKHYLNKRAKVKTLSGEKYYPLYIQIIAYGQKAQLKSKISDYLSTYKAYIEKIFTDTERIKLILKGYYTEFLLRKITSEKIFPLHNLINDEIYVVSRIIKNSPLCRNNRLSFSNFSRIYKLHLKNIIQILDEYIKKLYLFELNQIFLQATKSDETRKLFKVSNYFIHYIDWTNPLCDFYETTYEVLPTEIKFLENYLSEELKKDIKALLSFHSRNNYLKRFLDKTSKGKFPDINYIDWIEEAKDFIYKEFIKIFGRQKALEYITSLDIILSKEINHPFYL